MKKALMLFICIMLTVCAPSCAKEGLISEGKILGVQYIRTDGYAGLADLPCLVRFASVRDLEKYYYAYCELYDLNKGNAASQPTVGWLDAVEKYDSKWFESHVLYIAILEENSGSIRHDVLKPVARGNEIYLSIDRIVEEFGTKDTAIWHIMVELMSSGEFTGIMVDGNIYSYERPISAAEKSRQFFDSIILSAKKELSLIETSTIIGIDNPAIERLGYSEVKTKDLDFYYINFNTPDDTDHIWRVAFKTSDDEAIVYYLGNRGVPFARERRTQQ
jgi:hypothetical protein